MIIIIVLTLLLTNMHAYSVPIDSADADYCIDLKSSQPMIVFEKKNKDLKPILLNTQDSLKCGSYRLDTTAYFKLESGDEVTCYDFRLMAKLSGTGTETEELPPVIQLDYPESETILFNEKIRKKEELLLFKNRIMDATVKISISCYPSYLSSNTALEFSIPFRVRITGECPKY